MDNIRFFIISSAKTGTTTLYESFRYSGHIHNHKYLIRRHPHLNNIIHLKDLIDYSRQKFNRKPLIITAIREPIYRVISCFFQDITKYINKSKEQIKSMPMNQIVEVFLKHFKNKSNDYSHNDKSIMGGINIMRKPFNKQDGYSYYENGKVRILVLRFDKINEWPKIIPKHLYPDEQRYFKFKSDNVSSKKWYGEIYKEFLEQLKVPRKLIEEKFNSHKEVMEHFYTKEQIDKIKQSYEKLYAD